MAADPARSRGGWGGGVRPGARTRPGPGSTSWRLDDAGGTPTTSPLPSMGASVDLAYATDDPLVDAMSAADLLSEYPAVRYFFQIAPKPSAQSFLLSAGTSSAVNWSARAFSADHSPFSWASRSSEG